VCWKSVVKTIIFKIVTIWKINIRLCSVLTMYLCVRCSWCREISGLAIAWVYNFRWYIWYKISAFVGVKYSVAVILLEVYVTHFGYALITAFNFKPETTPSFSETSLVTLNNNLYKVLGHSTYLHSWTPSSALILQLPVNSSQGCNRNSLWVLSDKSREWIEENHGGCQSRQLVFRSRIEPSALRTLINGCSMA
jgi:hypothetical protein